MTIEEIVVKIYITVSTLFGTACVLWIVWRAMK